MRVITDMILMSITAFICWMLTDYAVYRAIEVDLLFPGDSRVGGVVAACSPMFFVAVILCVRMVRITQRLHQLRLPQSYALAVPCLVLQVPALYLLSQPWAFVSLSLGAVLMPFLTAPAVAVALYSMKRDLRGLELPEIVQPTDLMSSITTGPLSLDPVPVVESSPTSAPLFAKVLSFAGGTRHQYQIAFGVVTLFSYLTITLMSTPLMVLALFQPIMPWLSALILWFWLDSFLRGYSNEASAAELQDSELCGFFFSTGIFILACNGVGASLAILFNSRLAGELVWTMFQDFTWSMLVLSFLMCARLRRWKFERALIIAICVALAIWIGKYLAMTAIFFGGLVEGPFGGSGFAAIIAYIAATTIFLRMSVNWETKRQES